MSEDTIRLAIRDMACLLDEKYHGLAAHLSAMNCKFVGLNDPHDAVLRFDNSGDSTGAGEDIWGAQEAHQKTIINVLSAVSDEYAGQSAIEGLYLYPDDGRARVADVVRSAKDQLEPRSAHQIPNSARPVPARIVAMIEGLTSPTQFAMMISLGQLPLMNSRHGRSNIDIALQTLELKLLVFARDSISYDVALERTADGYFLLAEGAVDRSKWQWMAEEIVTMVRDSSLADDNRLMLSANIGLAVRRPEEAADQFVKRLSAGVSNARSDASAHVKWADRGSDLDQLFAATLEHDLAGAIKAGEVVVRFQPQFAIANGHLTGAEALARWEHPKMGELGASILFSVAERAGLMQPLSEYIQHEALRAAASWPAALSDLRLSINLTAHDFAAPDFVAQFMAMVSRSHFDPNFLTVEITETDLISDLNRASRLCAELRKQGMRVAIDDFGTGFSSLLYLKSLPLDYLKLDGAMSADIEGSPRDRVIVRSVVALGRALNLELVAEGVETAEQRDLLGEEGCQYYQGYLGGKAMDARAFIDFALRAN